ncbi:MAG: peptidylprolyl isomerase [Bacteroidota bacterium]|nr:peptidylprolyl isomerase [Bacteroidota bacterium]
MKKFLLVIASFLLLSATYCQTLFTYGKNAVSKDEFLRAYNKNKTATTDRDQAIKDYLNLYIKFRLKVQAAKDMHLDTLPSLTADMQNFRTQIQDNYLQDNKEVDALVTEAFNRSQKDIHVQHFYVAINDKMPPADTLKLYKAINEAYDELKKGGKDYDAIVSEIREEIAPLQGNDMGWITVFTLPYDYENIVYGLKPGQVSKPYRSKKGWHIFKNEEERPALGKITIAQILFAVPAGNMQMRDQAKLMADSVYAALKAGADFGEMAMKYSNDRSTFMNKGLMPEFGVAKYDGAFEAAAFSLKNDSDISKPFQTEFGYHILKRISRSPVPENKNDEAYLYNLKQEVLKDSRVSLAKDRFLKDVLVKTGFKKNAAVNEKNLWKVTDTFTVSNTKIEAGNVNDKTILFSFNNAKITVGDWMQYARSIRNTYAAHNEQTYPEQLKNYISLATLENYKNRLESFNPDFNYQLQEFKEGNMLFEVMQRKVWSKASSDTVGLKKYYDEHKSNYKWNASADAVLFSCANEAVAKNAMDEIDKGKPWQNVIKDNSQVQEDSGRYELSQIPVPTTTNFTAGTVTTPVVNKGDGTAIFSLILKIYPENQPRSFADARGLVINDYQNFLEQKWVEDLKKKYPIKVNDKVLQSLL